MAMNEPSPVLTERQDGILIVTIERPDARNAVNLAVAEGIGRAMDALDESAELSVGILTGAGGGFSSGMDLKAFVKGERPYWGNRGFAGICERPTIKPLIAAIEGFAVAGGLEIALACDLRIARANAGKIGLPEVSLGVLPGTGGTQRLARALGRAKAIELMAEGATFAIEEAKALGLINAVIDAPAGEFRARALEYARKFVPPAKASRAVGLIKRAVTTGLEVGLEQGLALERELQQRLFEGQDAKEGISAYNARRSPQFSGK
jgi:enoyl-CoA hydratase/carnithine racemase